MCLSRVPALHSLLGVSQSRLCKYSDNVVLASIGIASGVNELSNMRNLRGMTTCILRDMWVCSVHDPFRCCADVLQFALGGRVCGSTLPKFRY